MSDSSEPKPSTLGPLVCPECDATYQRGTRVCWLCGRMYRFDELNPSESLRPYASPTSEQSGSYTLATMMLMITLISVCLGLISIHPGLGAGFSVLALPAFLTTWSRVEERKEKGEITSAKQKVLTFVVALGLTVLICIASFGSFAATCAAGINPSIDGQAASFMLVLAFASPIVGLAVLFGAITLAKKMWPFRD